jgi:hypothetical protein
MPRMPGRIVLALARRVLSREEIDRMPNEPMERDA